MINFDLLSRSSNHRLARKADTTQNITRTVGANPALYVSRKSDDPKQVIADLEAANSDLRTRVRELEAKIEVLSPSEGRAQKSEAVRGPVPDTGSLSFLCRHIASLNR